MKVLVDAIPMTGLLTGIARYLRNMYAVMATMDQVEISYLAGKTLVHSMPPLADTEKWEKATATVWNLPDPIIFGLRSLYALFLSFVSKKREKNSRFLRFTYLQPSPV